MFAAAQGAGAPRPGCRGEAARSGSASARRVTDLHRLGPPSGPGASRGSPTALPRSPPRGWQSAGQKLSLSGVAPASSQCPWVPSSSPPSPCPSVWRGALTSSRRRCAGALSSQAPGEQPSAVLAQGRPTRDLSFQAAFPAPTACPRCDWLRRPLGGAPGARSPHVTQPGPHLSRVWARLPG